LAQGAAQGRHKVRIVPEGGPIFSNFEGALPARLWGPLGSYDGTGRCGSERAAHGAEENGDLQGLELRTDSVLILYIVCIDSAWIPCGFCMDSTGDLNRVCMGSR
jgi:hypothetical protein